MFRLQSALAGITTVAVLSFATASSAATALNGVTLHRVDVLGSTYDVTFRDGVFDTVFPDLDLPITSTNDAAAAVNAILSNAAYQSFLPAEPSFAGFLVPFGFRDQFVWAVGGGGYGTQGGGAWYRAYNYGDQYTWAEFNLSAVPEPAAWAMMIVGFGAVGSMVRTSRRRNALTA